MMSATAGHRIFSTILAMALVIAPVAPTVCLPIGTGEAEVEVDQSYAGDHGWSVCADHRDCARYAMYFRVGLVVDAPPIEPPTPAPAIEIVAVSASYVLVIVPHGRDPPQA